MIIIIAIGLISLNIKIAKSSCDIFNIITTPENPQRMIFQDLQEETIKDYSWGVWTKYLSKYEPIEDLASKTKSMHVLTENQEKTNYLVYYIVIDREESYMYHKLFIYLNNNFQIRELKVDQMLVQENWVFFYFCYSQTSQIYNIFLYVNGNRENVQMVSGGPFKIENEGLKIYKLGGLQTIQQQISQSQEFVISLSSFSGEITDMDLRFGTSNFYDDIPTFLLNIQSSNCVIFLCKNVMMNNMILGKQFLGESEKYQVSYVDSKFMIYGWVRLNELEDFNTIRQVLMRASLRRTYFDDLYQGDRALYWEYLQSNQNNEQNGIFVTTYHNDPTKSISSYQTQESDQWVMKGSYYQEAITFWHWIVYQEGINNINNIMLTIYFGQKNEVQSFTMTQNHFERSSLYFTIGGDKFNKNFRGEIRNLTFYYCYSLDTPKQRMCHYKCKNCYGPEETQCIDCDYDQKNRILNKGECKCKQGYIDNKEEGCFPISSLIKIDIQEAKFVDDSNCQLGEFLVQFYDQYYCLACPGQYTAWSLNCVECLANSKHWYLNPICKSDYYQPLQDQSDYVYLETLRNEIDYQYYLINQLDINDTPKIELCFGCQGQTDSDINFIENYQLNILSRIACKTCYSIINGECVSTNQNCISCDNTSICLQCEQDYTLFEGYCYQCPQYCPDCKKNKIGIYCQSCISGYYFNQTTEQCIQCGQYCSVCIYNEFLPSLQCIRCIDDKEYFISADRQMCRKKNMEHCEIQGEEYLLDGPNNFTSKNHNFDYRSTLDVKANFTTSASFQVCLLCEDQYVNKLILHESNECIHASDTTKLPNLNDQLKNLVLNSKDHSFQLAFSNYASQTTNYTVIYGQPIKLWIYNNSNPSTQVQYTFISDITSINYQYEDPSINCTNLHCIDCIRNYLWSQEYCIKCQNGYYANILTGLCYACPDDCQECVQQNQVFQDQWKWQLRPYYQFRSNIFYGFHHFLLFCITTDSKQYDQICTKCKGKDALQNGKCYKDCNCEECIFQNGQNKCLKCKDSKTYINGQCVQCPNYCDVCKQLTDSQINEINPYFEPTDTTLYRFAKQCLKQQNTRPENGFIYHDASLGLEVNCLNNEQLPCYKYAEKILNVYCTKERFDQDYSLLSDQNEKMSFIDQNIMLNEVFSEKSTSHFSNQEASYLFELFNEKSVKLMRYILKIKPNTGQCKIEKNTFVYSILKKNVFMLQFLELILESSIDIPIQFGNNITFHQFTSLTFKNILLDSFSGNLSIFSKNDQDISFKLEQFIVSNGENLKLQFILQNPNSISLKQVTLKNTQFENIDGWIKYYFTKPKLTKQLIINIEDMTIQDSEIRDSNFITQILNTNFGNQLLNIINLKSQNNILINSQLIYTQFENQIRQSQINVDQFLSDGDQLTQSSFFVFNGAMNVILNNTTIKNGKYFKQAILFKLPLFKIYNLNILDNQFLSLDNRILTNNLDSLYADNIIENKVTFNTIYLTRNSYVGNNVFIELMSSNNFINLNVEIDKLIMDSNQYTASNSINGYITASNASIYLDIKKFELINTQIIRSFNLPEFSINNADLVTIDNFIVTSNPTYLFKPIHSQQSCFNQSLENGYGSIIQFYNIKKINFINVIVKNIITINSPLLIIKSLERTNQRVKESINIVDHVYINNSLIMTRQSEQVAIFSVISEQEQTINLNQINAENNLLKCYQEDQKLIQSSTLLIVNPYSIITLNNSVFQDNIVIDSSGSNIIIFSMTLVLQNTRFQNQNKLKYNSLKDRLIWGYSDDEQIYFEHIQKEFPIKSKGGNGLLSSEEIILQNVTTNNSQALQGGAFYFLTVSSGIIKINNSNFIQSQSNLLSNDKSQGGTLFIDASQSMLQLEISNCNISGSSSRGEGGALFIEPSRDQNLIILESIIVQEIYSLQNAFLRLPILFTSSTLILNIQIINTFISNSYQGYLQFYGQVHQLSKSDISESNKNSLISIDGGNIILEEVQFQNIFQFGILNIQNVHQITITNVGISNITIINDNLIFIDLNKKYQTLIKFNNVKLESINEYSGSMEKPQIPSETLGEYNYRCFKNSKAPEKIEEFYNQNQLELQSYYNIYTIITSISKPSFIFGIDQVSINHNLIFYQVSFNSIKCQGCQDGILKITNIDNVQNQNLIQLKIMGLLNNQCGKLGCIFLSNQDKSQVKLFSQNNDNRLLADNSQLSEQSVFIIKIEDSKFDNNQATFGGALLISGVDVLINNCKFTNNYAISSGGSVYFDYETNSKFLIFNSLFADNKANIGGAIFLGNYSINIPTIQNNVFSNNKAQFFGNNQADQPVRLVLQLRNQTLETNNEISDDNNITDYVKTDPYLIGNDKQNYILVPSGQQIGEYQIFDELQQKYIPYNFQFRILALNRENDQVKGLDGSKCNIQGRQIKNEVKGEFRSNYTSFTEVKFNTSSQDYNLDSMIITFEPNLNENGYLQLEIMCDSIKIPQYSKDPPYQFQSYFTNYRLWINLQTFQCQRGEYKTDDGECKLCDSKSDQYNVIAGQRCKIKDQIKMEKVTPARIMLRPEYWRPSESNEVIEYCLNLPQNCKGGWNPGNDICDYAHIGALCEQCDIYDVRGQGSFSVTTQYKCGDCRNVGDNTIKIVLISIWTMISIFLSVKGTVQGVEKMVSQHKMHMFKSLRQDLKAGYGGVLIKVLTNYLQIIGAVSLFQLELPSALQSSIRSVGNPVEAMSYSLDCFLINVSDINIIYFRMIWALIMPIIYILTFGLIYILVVLLNITQSNKSAITTAAIYLFTYLQPTLLGGFISLLSFREISDIYWIQGNVAYKYVTTQHFKWVLGFVLPSTLTLALFIPFYMLFQLYNKRFKLEDTDTRKNWGYLYNEYQYKAYFWEIIKIFQKGSMIIFLTFYEDQIIIKGALIFIIVFIYQILTKKFRPYKLPYLNFLDEMSTLICGTSIVLGLTIYQANKSDNQEIIWPFYILLILINFVFIVILVWEILWAQLEDNQDKLDKVRDQINTKFPDLKKKNSFLNRLLTNRSEQQKRIKERYQKIKKYLIKIVRSNPGLYRQPNYENNLISNKNLEEDQQQLDNFPRTSIKIYPVFYSSNSSDSQLQQPVENL